MKRLLFFVVLFSFLAIPQAAFAQEASSVTEATVTTPTPTPRADFTQKSEETIGPLEKLLETQELGSLYTNPLKYAIREAVSVGVPPNTIILLLLLPLVAAGIAAARHLIGVRGFGIFMPAALSIAFVAIGPVVGIAIFFLIVFVSTLARNVMRKARFKMQYLPKMALILWFVVLAILGLLFLAPVFKHPDITNISIFPVLIIILLAEDFSKIMAGKSTRTAIAQATETIILSLTAYIVLNSVSIQRYALLHPEALLLVVGIFDILLGKYVGLRFVEYWRYRKLIKS